MSDRMDEKPLDQRSLAGLLKDIIVLKAARGELTAEVERLRAQDVESEKLLRITRAALDKTESLLPTFARLPTFAAWMQERAVIEAELARYREREPLVKATFESIVAAHDSGFSCEFSDAAIELMRKVGP